MTAVDTTACIAFANHRRIAAGPLASVARAVKEYTDREPEATVLVFDAASSARVEIDLRGTADEVVARLPQPAGSELPQQAAKAGPGRPRLGVVSREISLLPRHWDWLNAQPGGASVTLRRLVEEARRAGQGRDRARHAQEAVYRFVSVMAGDLPGFEEASRALYAKDHERFAGLIRHWPEDVRAHVETLAAVLRREEGEAE